MSLFRANLACVIRKPGTTNVFGEEQLGPAANARCAIIKLKITSDKTTVRADSSASRGAAREAVGEAELLFPVSTDIGFDDQIEVAGWLLRVTGIFPRHNLQGVLDHQQVYCAIWGKA